MLVGFAKLAWLPHAHVVLLPSEWQMTHSSWTILPLHWDVLYGSVMVKLDLWLLKTGSYDLWSNHVANQMFIVPHNSLTQKQSEKPTVRERGGGRETWYRFNSRIVLHSAVLMSVQLANHCIKWVWMSACLFRKVTDMAMYSRTLFTLGKVWGEKHHKTVGCLQFSRKKV